MNSRKKALLTLAFLSPCLGELLSGSAPPFEFFNPFGLILLVGLYGFGAILIRELAVRWKKGWASVLLMGAAYGIVEEGLVVKSFFDPGWVDLGDFAAYGRFLGVSWVWTYLMIVFHMLISIAIPILLLEYLYPEVRGKQLLTDRGFRIFFSLFSLDCIFMFLFLTDYYPPPLHYFLAFLAVIFLFYLAWRVPADCLHPKREYPVWKPWRFFLLGFSFMAFVLVSLGVLSKTTIHPVFAVFLNIAAAILVAYLFIHRMGRRNSSLHLFSFAAGILFFFVLLSFVLEINGALGMSLVGIFFTLLLLKMRKKIIEQNHAMEADSMPPPVF